MPKKKTDSRSNEISHKKSQHNSKKQQEEKVKKTARFRESLLNKEDENKTAEDKEMEEKLNQIKMRRNSKKRFGYVIKFDKYGTSNLIKIICIVIAVIIIPLQIFF